VAVVDGHGGVVHSEARDLSVGDEVSHSHVSHNHEIVNKLSSKTSVHGGISSINTHGESSSIVTTDDQTLSSINANGIVGLNCNLYFKLQSGLLTVVDTELRNQHLNHPGHIRVG